jgi:hypothetical protein
MVGRRWGGLLTGRGIRVGELVTGFVVGGVRGGNVGNVGKGVGAVRLGLGVTGALAASALATIAVVGASVSAVAAVSSAGTVGLGSVPVLFVPGTLRDKLCLWHTLHFVVIHPHTLVTLDAVRGCATGDLKPAV